MSYKDTFPNRVSIVIDDIEPVVSGDVVAETIEFTPHDNPDISIDTAGRFAVHEIIGGDYVRQKIGEDPLNIQVSGVCDEPTAKRIDQLRKAKLGRLISDRIIARVQFASMSTSPMESGGAVDASSGDYLYSYDISMVSTSIPVDESTTAVSGGGAGAQLE